MRHITAVLALFVAACTSTDDATDPLLALLLLHRSTQCTSRQQPGCAGEHAHQHQGARCDQQWRRQGIAAILRARGTRSNEAHELVQRSRFETDQFTAASLRAAVLDAEAAIAIDSTYADAWAALAWAWGVTADDFASAATAGPQMRHAAERALALDPTLADAHAQMGIWWMIYGHDLAAASREMEQALALDSANVNAGMFYPQLLTDYLHHLPNSAKAVLQRAERGVAGSRFSASRTRRYP
jgi:hypothetical protein